MKLDNQLDDEKIVDLAGRRSGEAADGAFGASIQRTQSRQVAANEQALGLVARIIMDESLPFYVCSLDGTVIHVNDHYKSIDKALGEMTLAPGEAQLAGRFAVPSLKPVIDDVLASDTTVRAEEIVRIGGHERIFLGRHTPVRNERGDVVAVAGTYEDVTAQVRGIEEANRTQSRFQDFARASSDWFFECDADMRIRSLSDRFTAIVGQPASLFIGSKFEQFGRFEENLDGRMDGIQGIKMRKPFREQLFVVSDPSGEELKFHLSAVPVFDRQTGDFRGYRGVGMDVSGRYKQASEADQIRKNLETLLRELTRKNLALDEATVQATSALRAKNEFLAAMSHELRTPLNAIIGFSEVLRDELFGPLGNERYQSYAKDICDSGVHLLSVINDILDLSKAESGQFDLHEIEFDLAEVLRSAIRLVKDAADGRLIAIHSDQAQRAGWRLVADSRLIKQILLNLLSNAVKFTEDGGNVDIQLSRQDDLIQIRLIDDGIGIETGKAESMFQTFTQGHTGLSRKYGGTGLGLPLSRSLAELHGGTVRLSGNEGRGATAVLELPASRLAV